MDKKVEDPQNNNKSQKAWHITAHALCDLSHISPLVFLHLLEECYAYGTCGARTKMRALRQHIYQVVHNDPQPGPAVFIAHCLDISSLFPNFVRAFTDLLISALHQILIHGTTREDLMKAQILGAKCFVLYIRRSIKDNLIVDIVQAFGVGYAEIQIFMDSFYENTSENAEKLVETYITSLIKSHSYTNAVSLLQHFNIRRFKKSLLYDIMESNNHKAAERLAIFIGRPMLRLLIQECIARNLLTPAYEIINRHNFHQEFLEICRHHEESLLKKLVEEGCWDIAEANANNNKQFLQYLVYLAIEAGYHDKVEELCIRHSLEGFADMMVPRRSVVHSPYLTLKDLSIEELVFVDEVIVLRDAICHIEKNRISGIDCECKTTGQRNEVCIMQIASGNKVYILDLIKLHNDAPKDLDECLTRILKSPSILKLGYNIMADINELSRTYSELQCFKQYEMVLDVEKVFKRPKGGLSCLAKDILGAPLDKTQRDSDWEQRPLNPQLLEYAAIDAACLIHIFRGVPKYRIGVSEWKSHIVTYVYVRIKSQSENCDGEQLQDFGTMIDPSQPL